jgi:tetratricopeptide (TPR) repeat protein
LCSPEEQQALTRFLKALRSGKSYVLITSRREEKWLDINYQLLEISGLVRPDTEALGNKILGTAGVDRRQLPPEYLELFDLLGGHPLSLQFVLPHLKTQSPNQLIDALRRGLDTFVGKSEEGRDKSLLVSLDCSFNCLSEKAQRHLLFLSFFFKRVNVGWLSSFSSGELNSDYKEAYQSVFGEILDLEEWLNISKEAVEAGLLQSLGRFSFGLHPILPWYLYRKLNSLCYLCNLELKQLSQINNKIFIKNLQNEVLISYTRLVYSSEPFTTEKNLVIYEEEELNLLQYLNYSIREKKWASSEIIFKSLRKLYDFSSRKIEFQLLLKNVLARISLSFDEVVQEGNDLLRFWSYTRNLEVYELLKKGDLVCARSICEDIIQKISNLKNSNLDGEINLFLNTLGLIFEEEREFDKAIKFYKKSLKYFVEPNDTSDKALIYHQLGNVFVKKEDFDKAIVFYKKAIKNHHKQDLYSIAIEHYQLGIVFHEKCMFEEAIKYYTDSLNTFKDLLHQNSTRIADVYNQLGSVYLSCNKIDKAQEYFFRSLKIMEDNDDHYKVIDLYHNLAALSWKKECFDDSITYCHKALNILEKKNIGNLYNKADFYHLLGLMNYEKENFDASIHYYNHACLIYSQYQDWKNTSKSFLFWGITLNAKGYYHDALIILLQGFPLCVEFNKEFLINYIEEFRQLFLLLEENQFSLIWKRVTGSEFEGEIRDVIIKNE